MGQLKYCFEQECVTKVLKAMKKQGLAVIDSDGIPARTVREAVDRGVFVYDYLNAGALEKERSFYADYKDLRLAKYDGWPGEYWIDPTSAKWKQHLVDEAKAKKAKGAIGLYFDNADIYWMASTGFDEEHCTMMAGAPSASAVYRALRDVIVTIVNDVGLIVMPNGGDDFVKKLVTERSGLIRTVNQEGVLYEDFHSQSSSEKKYRTQYLDWCKKHGLYIRGIEYTNTVKGSLECKAYYLRHGWQGLYISKHKDLRGD